MASHRRRCAWGGHRSGRTQSWLILIDDTGVGASLADGLRSRGHRVVTVRHDANDTDFTALLAHDDGVDGIVDCWPLDISETITVHDQHRLGVLAALRLVKAVAAQDTTRKPRLYLVTGNAQPAPGTELRGGSSRRRCGGVSVA